MLFAPKLPPPPPPTVQVIKAAKMDVPIFKEWVGTTNGYQNADILARVTGYLVRQDYVEGSFVKAGTVLFQIDPRPFEATLEQAKAQYAQAYAQAQLAEITLQRNTQLVKNNVISQQQYDTSYQSAKATIAMASAAKANVDSAQLNLQFCTLVAPFDGIVGIAQAQIGSLVGSGSNVVLTKMSQVDPIKVVFPISEQEYLQASAYINAYSALPKERRPPLFQLLLANGEVYPYKGKFDFANRQVDPNTGTIQITGLFPNPDHILRPGQYAMVKARVADFKNAIVVPQAAVTQIQGTYQLTLLNSDNTLSTRTVEVGPTYGPLWVITRGLQSGETVVVSGPQKIEPSMKVVPTAYPTPTPSSVETPRPFFTPPRH
ncbi:MAG: efflux transporter periplasmic adaptor subunit [Verrucomicrobia bacterium]|nr:MAG: efflux transporter periplasmic adaptor subunit [Verrucomicrobiota bacterium]